MKTAAILSSFVVGAAAFAPAKMASTSTTALQADLSAEVGAQAPLGFFDPLGVIGDPKNGDQEQFDKLRYIELKVRYSVVHSRPLFFFLAYTRVSVFANHIHCIHICIHFHFR